MNIKVYLKENKISVREMSMITSIPYSTLNDIVNNKVNLEECQYKTLKKIAVFLKVSIEDLVYEKEDFQTQPWEYPVHRAFLHNLILHSSKRMQTRTLLL